MNLAHSNAFRGSAAFFAMLLAAASSLAAEAPAAEISRSDQASPAAPHASPVRALALAGASKFTRRRLPLSQRRG